MLAVAAFADDIDKVTMCREGPQDRRRNNLDCAADVEWRRAWFGACTGHSLLLVSPV
jgi:hypothetical protein